MPDLSKSITAFDGEGGTSKAREWLEHIKSMKQLHNWPDSFALESANGNLKGSALQWYKSRQEEITS